ncbi:MAG: flagellar basal body rod protein FlgB [Methylococcaceae bacterium]|jgi:flagellar basal-body rod protein FlgB
MAGKLDDVFAFNENALRLRGQRQQLLASNIANADTPNYKAKDMDFGKAMHSALAHGRSASVAPLTQTNSGHLSAQLSAQLPNTFMRKPTQNNLDGNTVDMDVERNNFLENSMHYEADVNFTQNEIKGLLAVLQG